MELFFSKGYAASSVREIAARVGIQDASLYKHIRSKEELLYIIVTESTRHSMENIRSAVAMSEGLHSERLRAAVKAHVAYHCRHKQTVFIGTSELRSLNPKRRQSTVRLRDEYEAIFKEIITAGVAQGVFICPSVSVIAKGILGLGTTAPRWYRPDGDLSPEDVGDMYADFTLRAILVDRE